MDLDEDDYFLSPDEESTENEEDDMAMEGPQSHRADRKEKKNRKIKDDGGDLGDHISKVPSLTSPDSFESLCYDGQRWEGMRFNRSH